MSQRNAVDYVDGKEPMYRYHRMVAKSSICLFFETLFCFDCKRKIEGTHPDCQDHDPNCLECSRTNCHALLCGECWASWPEQKKRLHTDNDKLAAPFPDIAAAVVKSEQKVKQEEKPTFPAEIFTSEAEWPWPLLKPGKIMGVWKVDGEDDEKPIVNRYWCNWDEQLNYFRQALEHGSKLQCQKCDKLRAKGEIDVHSLDNECGRDSHLTPPVLCLYCLQDLTSCAPPHDLKTKDDVCDGDDPKLVVGQPYTLTELADKFHDSGDSFSFLCQVCGDFFHEETGCDRSGWDDRVVNTCYSCNRVDHDDQTYVDHYDEKTGEELRAKPVSRKRKQKSKSSKPKSKTDKKSKKSSGKTFKSKTEADQPRPKKLKVDLTDE